MVGFNTEMCAWLVTRTLVSIAVTLFHIILSYITKKISKCLTEVLNLSDVVVDKLDGYVL